MVVNIQTLSKELTRWFSKSIIEHNFQFENDGELLHQTLQIFATDYKRYFPEDKSIFLNQVLSRSELVGILLYRLARIYFLNNRIEEANKCSLLGRFLSSFEIYYSAEIGFGLKINHGLGTVIGARTKIGNNLLIHQGVTFGDKNGGRPTIGNNVVIYAGAKILGNISIGNHCIVAANCVCFTNVPDNKIIVGIPARILNK